MEQQTPIDGIRQMFDKILSLIDQDFECLPLLKERMDFFCQEYQSKSDESVVSHEKQPYNLEIKFKTEPKAVGEKANSQKTEPIGKVKGQDDTEEKKKPQLPKPNIFEYTYSLPCSFETFQRTIRELKIQRKTDDYMDEYQVLKEMGKHRADQYQLIYLSYKKMLLIAARQFIYARVFIHSENMHWVVTFSVPFEKESDKRRAEIILTVNQIEQLKDDKGNPKVNIRVLSEVDMKVAIKAEMAKPKGFAEIKKYVSKLYAFAEYVKNKSEKSQQQQN